MTIHKLERYAKKLIKNKGFSEEKEKEVYAEILDHMILLYEERLELGEDSNQAFKNVKSEFNETQIFPCEAMENYYIENNQKTFNWKTQIKVLSIQNIVYFSLLVILSNSFSTQFEYKLLIGAIDAVVISITGIYLYKLFKDTLLIIKSFLKCNMAFFISRIGIVAVITFLNGKVYLFLDNFWGFIFLNIISVLLITLINRNSNKKQVIRRHNSATMWGILCIGVLAMLGYALFPNNSVLVKGVFELLVSDNISRVDKNIFYMVVNKRMLIPNFGMYVVLLLGGAELLHRGKLRLAKNAEI
jgi:hypothetical protein